MTVNLKTFPSPRFTSDARFLLLTRVGLGVFASLVKMFLSEASSHPKRPSGYQREGRVGAGGLWAEARSGPEGCPQPWTPSTRQVLPVCKSRQGARVSERWAWRLVFC